jgi:hypothetical protein
MKHARGLKAAAVVVAAEAADTVAVAAAEVAGVVAATGAVGVVVVAAEVAIAADAATVVVAAAITDRHASGSRLLQSVFKGESCLTRASLFFF